MPLDPKLDLVIRPLERSDESAWRTLWTAYLDYYETVLPEAIYASTFERLLKDDSREFHGLLAALDGEPVGLVHFVFHRSCWSIEDTCYLQDLFVAPEVRGRSIGRALIEAVYEAADASGNPDVYWQTQHFNARGRRLYDRVGKLSDFIIYERA